MREWYGPSRRFIGPGCVVSVSHLEATETTRPTIGVPTIPISIARPVASDCVRKEMEAMNQEEIHEILHGKQKKKGRKLVTLSFAHRCNSNCFRKG